MTVSQICNNTAPSMAKFCILTNHQTQSELRCSAHYELKSCHGDNHSTQHNSFPNTFSNADATHMSPSSSTSSSIGINSSCTSLGSPARASDDEAESCLHDPLEGMAALQAFLPPRIGLSRFIGGKSRSFTCLADVFSIKNLAKPENPYARRRRSYKHRADAFGRRKFPPPNSACRISKKSVCSSRSNLALALAMALKEKGKEAEKLNLCNNSRGILERSTHPRSFSMAYLQQTGSIFSASKKF